MYERKEEKERQQRPHHFMEQPRKNAADRNRKVFTILSWNLFIMRKIIKNGVKRTRKHILALNFAFFRHRRHRCHYNTERVWNGHIFHRLFFSVVAVVYSTMLCLQSSWSGCACYVCGWKRHEKRIVNATVFNWFSCFVKLLSNTIEIMRNHCFCSVSQPQLFSFQSLPLLSFSLSLLATSFLTALNLVF